MEGDLIFKTHVSIKAAQSRVWDALINPEMTQQYMFGCIPVTDWKIGSPILWRGLADNVDYVIGEVIALEPESLLSTTTFNPHMGYADVPENYLTGEYHLSHADGITTINIVQGDFAKVEDGEKRYADAAGAWDHALKKLKDILEASCFMHQADQD